LSLTDKVVSLSAFETNELGEEVVKAKAKEWAGIKVVSSRIVDSEEAGTVVRFELSISGTKSGDNR